MTWLRLACTAIVLLASTGVAVKAARAAELAYDLSIANGQVPESMRSIRVKQGDVVKLRWSTDRPVTVHLHGYDIEKDVKPGAVTDMTFTARATGRFAVHLHPAAGAPAGQAHEEAPLVSIEVFPR
jgi:hypothetical protein